VLGDGAVTPGGVVQGFVGGVEVALGEVFHVVPGGHGVAPAC
jgi:hypothetical protein